LLSAVLHGAVLLAALSVRWHYTIFTYQEKAREAFLVPREVVRFPLAQTAVTGVPSAKERTAAAVAGPANAAEASRPAAVPPAPGKPGSESGGSGAGLLRGPTAVSGANPEGGWPGAEGGFHLSYPPEAKIDLSRSADSIEDRYLPSPSHYRSWAGVDFSGLARQGAILGQTPTVGRGEGPGGAGGGRPGQAGQRARRPAAGGSVSINVPSVDFSAWGEIVINKIQRNWALDPGLGTAWKGEVGVSVLVARNGDLLAVEIDVPAKIEFLDQAALRAVRTSGPFPALPARYANSSLEVYFVFKYGD
jgi:TonB family protein